MAIIERASIPTGTLKLKRLKNDMKDVSSNRYKYVVEFPDGDQASPRFTKSKAMTEFNRIKNNRQETTSSTTNKKEKAKGIVGKLGSAASQISSGGASVMEDMESGGGIDPLGLESDKSSDTGSLDDQLGIDMGSDSSGDLDMDLEDFD